VTDDVDYIECACYTQARRHPEVIGRIGRTVLPFQLTAPSLAVGLGSFLALLFTWRFWTIIVPSPFSVIVVIAAPLVLGRLAQVTRLEGRSPFKAAGGALRFACRTRDGVVAGRTVRRGRRGVLAGRIPMIGDHP